MNLLADENMARQVVERLRQDGHQIEYITEGPRGRDDTDIIDLANRSAAIVLTDDKDFGELVVRQVCRCRESFLCASRG